MMYLGFSGYNYYGAGGVLDLSASGPNKDEVVKKTIEHAEMHDHGWFHVYELETNCIVAAASGEHSGKAFEEEDPYFVVPEGCVRYLRNESGKFELDIDPNC